MSDPSDPYDDIPYLSCAYPQSHPGNLAVIAALFGMQPRSLENARVLEIGCAGGGNLLPMAAAFPGSRFVGVDPSRRQIAEAHAGVAALQLRNAEFYPMSLGDIPPEFGSFDYVVAHGVYSWVAGPVREQLMALCGRLLNPMGVAYLSYNTLPGSATRAALGAMVQFHTRHAASAVERLRKARSFFAFLEAALLDRDDAYARSMKEELSQMAALEDYYVAHEHLEENNDPCYFHGFIAHAQQHGLQFLGEAEIQTMSSAGFPAQVREGLRGMASDIVEAEQYGDFVRNRAFRQTLLCRAGIELKRQIPPERLQSFHFAASLDPAGAAAGAGGGRDGVRSFRDADGVIIGARDALTEAALLELRAVWPGSLTFAELWERAVARAGIPAGPREVAALCHNLLTCYSTSRGLEFHFQPAACRPGVPELPSATALARWQAGRGSQVTNLRHQNVLLGPAELSLLRALDGSRSVPELEQEFADARVQLDRFGQAALLVS